MVGWTVKEDTQRHMRWHGDSVTWFDVLTNKISVDRSSVGNALYVVLNLAAGSASEASRSSSKRNFANVESWIASAPSMTKSQTGTQQLQMSYPHQQQQQLQQQELQAHQQYAAQQAQLQQQYYQQQQQNYPQPMYNYSPPQNQQQQAQQYHHFQNMPPNYSTASNHLAQGMVMTPPNPSQQQQQGPYYPQFQAPYPQSTQGQQGQQQQQWNPQQGPYY